MLVAEKLEDDNDDMTSNIVTLPEDFIGKDDQARLESFGAHLLSHGVATRWHWRRERGIDVAFELFRGARSEELVASIERDRERDVFTVSDGSGRRLHEGTLEKIMTIVDARLRFGRHPPSI